MLKKYLLLIIALTGGLESLRAQGVALDSLIAPSFAINIYSDGTREFLRDTSTGKMLLYAGELWLGGYDQNQQLHQSAQTYKQQDVEYFPGPISDSYNNDYNRLWHIRKSQIDSLRAGLYTTIPDVILEWPAHGDTSNGEPLYLAPFEDVDNSGWYDPHHGDYPSIKGTEAVYFIYNDKTDGTFQNLNALEVDIHGMAYYVQNGGIADSALFLDYRIVNRSDRKYTNMYIGSWADMDLGNSMDDLIGTSINHNALIGYGADPNDDGPLGFGGELAALAQFIRRGPVADFGNLVDDDRDGCVDAVWINGQCVPEDSVNGPVEIHKMDFSNFYYNQSSSPAQNDPQTSLEYYNILSGLCTSGAFSLLDQGTGIWNVTNPDRQCGSSGMPSSYIYPGNSFDSSGVKMPDTDVNWFMPPSVFGDMRSLISSGPFTLSRGEAVSFNMGFVWNRVDSAKSMLDGGYSDMLRKLDSLLQPGGVADSLTNDSSGVGNVVHVLEKTLENTLELSLDTESGIYEIRSRAGENQSLSLYSTSGQLLKTFELLPYDKLKLNLQQYPTGVYLLGSEISPQVFKLIR